MRTNPLLSFSTDFVLDPDESEAREDSCNVGTESTTWQRLKSVRAFEINPNERPILDICILNNVFREKIQQYI